MATSTNPTKTPIKALPRSENSDPNLPVPSTPSQKPTRTPLMKSSSKPKKPMSSALQTSSIIRSPPPPPPPQQQQRKFVFAKKNKKNPRKGEESKDFDPKKAAYEALRASQDDFFRKDRGGLKDGSEKEEEKEEKLEGDEMERMRSLVMEEALSSIPEPGSGRVKHLVKAFESLLSISEENEGQKSKSEGRMGRVMNWELPGLREPIMKKLESVKDDEGFRSVFSSAEFERDLRLYSSLDSNGDRLSLGSRTSNGSRRSRRNSLDSSRRSWNKKLKVTSQQPFKLRTEQRGRLKEENFIKKVKEMITEEEKKRIPIAQGLPWTTDEPECLVKPPVKESTEAIDLVLHSDVRAVERAEFDHYVTERLSFIEQIKLERERLQKLEEEEEIRRLRKELVPKAQPMPYFDRPFIPKKSARPRTIPKEPRFHVRPMKSSCVSMLGRL